MKTATRKTNTTTTKHPVINERDFDRLNDLVQSPRFRASHAPMVATLQQELARGELVAPTSVPHGVVTMHTQVRFRDLATGERETYTVVYPEEADVNEGKLSVLAPLGTALLGTKAGDVVDCCAPGGKRRLKIEKILYQPEAAGDYHL